MFGIPLIIIISSIILGIYVPSYGKEISPIVPILQSILIFLSTIKVDFNIYKKYMEPSKTFLVGILHMLYLHPDTLLLSWTITS